MKRVVLQNLTDMSANKLKKQKILFVDDDPLVLDVGKKMFESLGFTVYTVANGLEAVNKVCNHGDEFSAVVMDVLMPEMDGIEAMITIKKRAPNLPVILCSGYPEYERTIEVDHGQRPDAFLNKPFQISKMRSSLEALLS